MNKQLMLISALSVLLGCNPFGAREMQTNDFVSKVDAEAASKSAAYKANIRQVKPYQVYQYQVELADPFRIRQFLIQEQKREQKQLVEVHKNRCLPPSCVPPTPHDPQLLESYALNALQFVGTLGGNDLALIKTPDYGVVTVREGDYVGKNNGRIQAINESSIVLHEKIQKNGLWEDKKTILVITR